MFKALLFLFSFFISGVILASPNHTPQISVAKSDLSLQCENSGYRVFSEYRSDGFSNVTGVRNWCDGFMSDFGIPLDQWENHCGWNRSGSYGRYQYAGIFLYARNYPGRGNPSFYFEPFCYDDGGGNY